MSASPATRNVLSCIAQSLADELGRHSQAETAQLLGCSQSSVSRRGEDLTAWSAADLIVLCLHWPAVAEALNAGLTARRPVGASTAVNRELLTWMRLESEMMGQIAVALEDGFVEPAECRELMRRYAHLRRAADEHLLPALRAGGQEIGA